MGGEVPERATFNQKDFRVALVPYLALTQAVRAGNLLEFNSVLKTHTPVFKADKTFTLVIRLSHNVIKTGLRRINVSYSRISMIDICSKLHLDSPESAEFVCAKAIRDGVIDAVLDHENGWMQSNEVSNVYATDEPQRAFHKRISFCLDVHNEAVPCVTRPMLTRSRRSLKSRRSLRKSSQRKSKRSSRKKSRVPDPPRSLSRQSRATRHAIFEGHLFRTHDPRVLSCG